MTEKKMKTQRVTFEQFCDCEFLPPGSFYIRDATGDYLFMKTSVRVDAQKYIDTEYGVGKYRVVPAKSENVKSKQESGGYSCTGTSTRRGQKR